MYYLKLFDETLIEFEMKKDIALKIYDINIVCKNKKIFPELLQENITEETILSFLKQKTIPKSCAHAIQILQSQDLSLNDIKGIIDVSKGLSLNDCYWVVEDDNLKFDDFNLYDNNFSKILALIAFTGYSSKVKGIITSPEYTTNGALPKAWRRVNNKVYLYK